jgi:hypothetical protein
MVILPKYISYKTSRFVVYEHFSLKPPYIFYLAFWFYPEPSLNIYLRNYKRMSLPTTLC